jgi:hypothetical protein
MVMEKYVHINLHSDCNSDYISGFDVKIEEGLENSITSFVNAEKYVPQKGDLIYLLPGVNIPRVKLKDLALNLGIRVTRDSEKANIIFSGKSSTGKMTTSQWQYMANADTILESVKSVCKDEYYIEKLETAITISGATNILASWSDMRNCLSNENKIEYESTYIYQIESEYLEIYNNIQGKSVYDESELIANINGDDSTIIDEQVYQQLKTMFQSSDDDNHILAMEIMANSHYEKSILYLQMLLSDYQYQINNSHTRNHVNFKSMLSYFNWVPRDIQSRSAHEIIKKIDEKKLITLDMIKRVYTEYQDSIHRGIYYDDVFEIKEITIKQEYLDKLNLSSLNLINPEEENNLEVTEQLQEIIEIVNEIIPDELLEAVLTDIKTNDFEIELTATEEELSQEQGTPEEESNNNQIEESNGGDDFEWF